MTDTLQRPALELEHRAQQLRDAGRRSTYAIDYQIVSDPAIATDINIFLGEQWSGKRLYVLDLDSHTPEQNADAAKEALRAARPELYARLPWYRSKHGGWHAPFESSVQIAPGKLYDQAGNHIGELLGADNTQLHDPGDILIPILHGGEVERLLNVLHVEGSASKGERWADRAKQGAAWTRGAQYIPVTRAQLRAFLLNDAGTVGRQLDSYFDTPPRNRSDAAGALMQNLLFFARKLPGCANAPFHVVCANVKAYWLAADSFGKAGEKGYSQDKDGDSLIAQIIHGDPYGHTNNPRHWKCPSWVPGATITAAPAPAPAPPTSRPAHRPAGDRDKHLSVFRRVLEAIEPDAFGRRTFVLEYLADKMHAARYPVKPRTIQSYLKALRDAGEISNHDQVGGNGMPFVFLTSSFGGANNYQQPGETAKESPAFGGADQIAEQCIPMLETAETSPQCKEDHQNPSAPLAAPPAPPAPAVDEWAGIDAEIEAWKQTTRDGQHFAKLQRQQEATAEDIVQLASVLRPAWRELVGEVRDAAKLANEPGCHLRDYYALSVDALAVELRRLQALTGSPRRAQAFGDLPQTTLITVQAWLL